MEHLASRDCAEISRCFVSHIEKNLPEAMSSHVWSSAVIPAPINKVWELVRPLNFGYLPAVNHNPADHKDEGLVGASHVITYKDGTKQTVRLSELSDAHHTVSWDLVDSVPAIDYLSVSHTLRLRRVTEDNATFIEWDTQFSKDATVAVTEDARHKQVENFNALKNRFARK